MSQKNSTRSPHECEQIEELIPAYSIGATDPEESALVEAHLDDCPELQVELADYRALAEGMLYSMPRREAPSQLAASLMAAAGQSPHRTGWINRLSTWVAIAAAILLVVTNVFWISRINDLNQETDVLSEQLAEHAALLDLYAAGDPVYAALATAAGGESTGATATVIWNPVSEIGLILATDFPPLPPDMAYQVWLIDGEERISGGLFTVNETGTGTLVIHAPEPFERFETVGITPEPATGSEGPTAPPVVRGAL